MRIVFQKSDPIIHLNERTFQKKRKRRKQGKLYLKSIGYLKYRAIQK